MELTLSYYSDGVILRRTSWKLPGIWSLNLLHIRECLGRLAHLGLKVEKAEPRVVNETLSFPNWKLHVLLWNMPANGEYALYLPRILEFCNPHFFFFLPWAPLIIQGILWICNTTGAYCLHFKWEEMLNWGWGQWKWRSNVYYSKFMHLFHPQTHGKCHPCGIVCPFFFDFNF